MAPLPRPRADSNRPVTVGDQQSCGSFLEPEHDPLPNDNGLVLYRVADGNVRSVFLIEQRRRVEPLTIGATLIDRNDRAGSIHTPHRHVATRAADRIAHRVAGAEHHCGIGHPGRYQAIRIEWRNGPAGGHFLLEQRLYRVADLELDACRRHQAQRASPFQTGHLDVADQVHGLAYRSSRGGMPHDAVDAIDEVRLASSIPLPRREISSPVEYMCMPGSREPMTWPSG